jgi:protein-S-isoprenylcysteine O-methyltransferase Ste14
MTIGQSTASPGANGGMRWLAAAASLCVGAAFLGLWFWLLPPVLGFQAVMSGPARWRGIAAVPSLLGFAAAIKCIWDFGWTGYGTPAPLAPPQKLVAVGFYRYVRNPMYVGFFVGWICLWILFGRASQSALAVLVAALAAVVLFVRFYEEPTLRGKFGADYTEYCRNVPRWIPRLRAWAR